MVFLSQPNFIDDITEGFYKSISANNAYGEFINLGTGFECSISDLVKIISKILGVQIEVSLDKSRLRPEKSEVDRLLACNKKAKNLIDWSPKRFGIEGLEFGLSKTVNWFKVEDNRKLYYRDGYNI